MQVGNAYIVVAVLAVLGFIGNVVVGAVLGILAILLYFVHQQQQRRQDSELAQARQRLARQRENAVGSPRAPEPLPADGSMPTKRPGESEAEWAARVQAAEVAAFKKRSQ